MKTYLFIPTIFFKISLSSFNVNILFLLSVFFRKIDFIRVKHPTQHFIAIENNLLKYGIPRMKKSWLHVSPLPDTHFSLSISNTPVYKTCGITRYYKLVTCYSLRNDIQ